MEPRPYLRCSATGRRWTCGNVSTRVCLPVSRITKMLCVYGVWGIDRGTTTKKLKF